MNGFLIIDKPQGETSFDIVRQVRRLSHTRKVGHAGTLDPMATGVLPVAIGKATRLIEYVMDGEKTYRATMKLGTSTDTQDSEGQVVEEKGWHQVTEEQVLATAARFVGSLVQLPPMYSAIKKDGQPLYKLARQGIEVERKTRQITIKNLNVDEVKLPYVTFTAICGKGTYIRTLCHDIGQRLGCGAHMTSLRRLTCGPFEIDDSHKPERLKELVENRCDLPLVAPVDAMADWMALGVEGEPLKRLQNGVAPTIEEVSGANVPAGTEVKFVAGGELLALARYLPERQGKYHGDFELIKVFPLEQEG